MSASSGSRQLTAARLIGATATAVVGQAAVDMPHGPLGGGDLVTHFGAMLSGALVLLAVASVVALRRRNASAPALGGLLLSAIVASFLPALSSDPLVAGPVVIWSLYLLGRRLVGLEQPSSSPARREQDGDLLGPAGAGLRHLTTVSLALIIVVLGLELAAGRLVRYLCAGLAVSVILSASPRLVPLLRRGHRPTLLLALITVAALGAIAVPGALLGLLAAALAVLLLGTAPRGPLLREIAEGFTTHPSLLVVVSFLGVIVAGTLLLSFPAAAPPGHRLAPLDALFTATSAVCVTGLIVVDTPTALSPLGHLILLALIQAGGLGIMILSTFATMLLGGRLGLRGESLLGQVLEVGSTAAVYRMTRFIVAATFVIEAMGALALTPVFVLRGEPLPRAIWLAVFHSVSAFCNAGFSLFSDSMVGLQSEPWALLVVALLIVLGGAGFMVLYALWNRIALRRRLALPVQVRIVAAGSTILIAAGWLLFAVLEWRGSLASLSVADRLLNALFQSVTLRTAGFNSVSFTALAPASMLFMTTFMFVGASPGGTGGGIKVSTLAVLLAAVRAIGRGDREVTLFDREISRETIYRAFAVLFTSLGILVVTLGLLLVVERQDLGKLLFEAASAVGTVGLSLGATPLLSPLGRLLIILAMLAGRVGPLTLALILSSSRRQAPRVRYPQATVLVG